MTAAFIFNFVLYTEWAPSALEDPARPIDVSVLGDREVADTLRQLFAGRRVSGRAVEVRKIDRPDTAEALEQLRQSQVVFIGSEHRTRAQWLLKQLEGANTLTIGCFPGFARDGGMLNLTVLGRKMRFEANFEAIQQGRITVSSEVLRLADLVGADGIGRELE